MASKSTTMSHELPTTRQYMACQLCQADEPRHLFMSWDMWNDLENLDRERFSFVQCRQCGLVYLNPRVPPEDIGAFYPEDYQAHTVPSITKPAAGSPVKRWMREQLYRWRRTLFDDLCRTADPKPVKSISIRAFKLSLKIRANLMAFPTRELNLLDIGCGTGRYLAEQQRFGWDVFGVEPNARAVEICQAQGLSVRQGYFQVEDWGENVFDVVTLFQVAEHLPDPAAIFRQIYRVLKPGGLIYLTVPNFRSIPARLFRTYWIGVADTPRHYFLFAPDTLSQFLAKAGFEPMWRYTHSSTSGYTAAIEFFLRERMGMKIERDAVRKHRLLSRLFVPLVRLVDWFNLGDNLYMIAQKPECVNGRIP